MMLNRSLCQPEGLFQAYDGFNMQHHKIMSDIVGPILGWPKWPKVGIEIIMSIGLSIIINPLSTCDISNG